MGTLNYATRTDSAVLGYNWPDFYAQQYIGFFEFTFSEKVMQAVVDKNVLKGTALNFKSTDDLAIKIQPLVVDLYNTSLQFTYSEVFEKSFNDFLDTSIIALKESI